MISSGDGAIGASKLTGEVMGIMTELPSMVKNITGVDINKVTIITHLF